MTYELPEGSNRTIVGLKATLIAFSGHNLNRSNRTIVGLKAHNRCHCAITLTLQQSHHCGIERVVND